MIKLSAHKPFPTYTLVLLTYLFETAEEKLHPIKSLAVGVRSNSSLISNAEMREAERNFPGFMHQLKNAAIQIIGTTKSANLTFDKINLAIQKIVNVALKKETSHLSDIELTKALKEFDKHKNSLAPLISRLQTLSYEYTDSCMETAVQLTKNRAEKFKDAIKKIEETLKQNFHKTK